MSPKKRKVRVEFKKNREKQSRRNDLTRQHLPEDIHPDSEIATERMSGKGYLTRHRTIVVHDDPRADHQQKIDDGTAHYGRVLSAVGLTSRVVTDDGVLYECTTPRVLRTRARDARNAVVTGDHVFIEANGHTNESGLPQASIEWVGPRHGIVSRGHGNREHILATNVDLAIIVASAEEPPLKPSLVDRFLISCEKGEVRPVVCINKADLVPTARLAPILHRYRQLGYTSFATSALTGQGIGELQQVLNRRTTVFTGQSGVGKSSLLNAIDPNLAVRTGEVSQWTMKGKHTTRRAEMHAISSGGFVIDTPGIRQFQLWEVDPAHVEELFVEFIRYVPHCRFPDCSHTHETDCAVKQAVDLGLIHSSRYNSYQRIFNGLED